MSIIPSPTAGAWSSASVAAGEIWFVHVGAINIDHDTTPSLRLGHTLFAGQSIAFPTAKTIFYRQAGPDTALIGNVIL